MSTSSVSSSIDREILEELVRIRKLLILQLVAQDLSPSVIGKALGVTAADQVRKLVVVKKIQKRTTK